jgi:acyl-coenzyme A synthetase/AMP-(fatty) acid ligase
MRGNVSRQDSAANLAWLNGRPVPTDFGGPVDVPFEKFLPQWIDQPAIRRFHAMADLFGAKIAIDDGTTRMTYRAVRAAVADLAARIVAATPESGPIAAVLDNTSAFPIVFLACLMTGRPIIPVDSSYPPERQQAILQECGAVAVILGEGLSPPEGLAPSLPRLNVTTTGTSVPEVAQPAVAIDIDAPAGVIYTSGSTGRPKGVAFTQRQFLASLSEYINACHIGHQDRLLGLASLGGASVREALAALLTGATFHISDLRQSGIGAAFRTMKNAGVTVLAFVPSVLRSFTARPDAAEALATLRLIDLFGELVTLDAVAALRVVLPPSCHIRVGLGSTETMTLFHWFVPREFVAAGPGLPCGYLASNVSVMLLDDDGAPVEPGSVGELVVRGRYIASGMWRDGAVWAGPFMRDVHDPASRIYHTGDLVRLRADGLAEFVGRRDRRVKIHGLRADPGDIETALHRIPGIADCAVVTRSSGDNTAFLAYIVASGLGPGGPGAPSVRQIRVALRAELPPHMMPAEIHLRDSIPRLPNFKPDLVALARDDLGATAPAH